MSALPADESSDLEAFGRLNCCPYTANMTFTNSDNQRAWPTSYIKKCVMSCQNIRPKTPNSEQVFSFGGTYGHTELFGTVTPVAAARRALTVGGVAKWRRRRTGLLPTLRRGSQRHWTLVRWQALYIRNLRIPPRVFGGGGYG